MRNEKDYSWVWHTKTADNYTTDEIERMSTAIPAHRVDLFDDLMDRLWPLPGKRRTKRKNRIEYSYESQRTIRRRRSVTTSYSELEEMSAI